ncbi:hypothetical protein ABEB36_000628 [Hypothenemus hampei]|uniref:Pro-resilin n=1 Tax=Hypothenemus hampei TaxID=57062 RepID=A0ABD1FCP2_HYPHA
MKISIIIFSTISIALAELPVPSSQYLPSNEYLPPQNNYLPPVTTPVPQYLPPSTSYGIPSRTQAVTRPNTQYGAPTRNYIPPSTSYGTPSPTYGTPSTSYGTPTNSYGAPSVSYGAPSATYGAPYAGRGGYDDQSEPANYEFEYHVQDPPSGNDFGHKEQRQGDVAQGKYFVLLPDGRLQTVEYIADENGYRPKISYQQVGGGYSGGGYPSGSPGYQYRK